ncbi:MAG: preprotein translocase subunit SecG [Cyanobacteria bacterium M5B4]|nr:preprotein translocase subunit SecG [Cyanobacteria bacterium KgW148]PLS68381.1 MAG: preprotein translocase subunit SecG [Cyanobacteria bacterium M5B4]
MYSFLQVVWIVVSILMIFLVLLHSPKGDGLGGLGGQGFTATKSAEKTLNQITWLLLIAFLGIAIVLSAGWIKPNPPALPAPPPAASSAPTIPSALTTPEN